MSVTPILGITELLTNQGSKEVTINDMIRALEAATNATLPVDLSGGPYILTEAQFTGNMIFRCVNATAATVLYVPTTIQGTPASRTFVVRNTSGYAVTVKSTAPMPGSSVIVPNNASRLLDIDGEDNVIVAAEPATVVALTALTDTPGSYTGQAGKALIVNISEDGVEFLPVASQLDGLSDVDLSTTAPTDGQSLVYNSVTGMWEPSSITGGGSTFVSLSDTPSDYTGKAGLIPVVNNAETGLEFSSLTTEAIQYVSAQRWRIHSLDSAHTFVAIAEIEFIDREGNNIAVGGTATASSEESLGNANDAFDSDTETGWSSTDPDLDPWIEYEFATEVEPRQVRIHPNFGFPEFTPTVFAIEYYDGTTWVNAGTKTPDLWEDTESQLFPILGEALEVVPEAPSDGNLYGRKDGDWEALDVVPEAPQDGQQYARKDGDWLPVESGFADAPADDKQYARMNNDWVVSSSVGTSETIDDATTARVLSLTDANKYIRFTGSSPKTLTVPDDATVAFEDDAEIHIRNNGFGNLTISGAVGVVINLSTGGTYVLQPGMTVTLKRVAANQFDLLGMTVRAEETGSIPKVVTQTESYTATDTDEGGYIRMNNALAVTLTVPAEATLDYPIGTRIYCEQMGEGGVTITPAIGVTINSRGDVYTTAGQFAVAALFKVATDEWILSGDLL